MNLTRTMKLSTLGSFSLSRVKDNKKENVNHHHGKDYIVPSRQSNKLTRIVVEVFLLPHEVLYRKPRDDGIQI